MVHGDGKRTTTKMKRAAVSRHPVANSKRQKVGASAASHADAAPGAAKKSSSAPTVGHCRCCKANDQDSPTKLDLFHICGK